MEQNSPLQVPPHGPNWLFYNANGLRAGWRIVVYLMLLAAVGFLVGRIIALAHLQSLSRMDPAHPVMPASVLWTELTGLLVVIVATCIMSLIESRKMGDYGLPLLRRGMPLLLRGAFFWGLLPLSALLFVLHLLGGYGFGTLQISGLAILKWALAWGAVFLAVGVFEEYTFRGYLQFTLADGLGFWPAAVLTSVLFACVHIMNQGETRLGILDVFLDGMFACMILRYTGNLWLAVGQHAAWDWAQSFLYGVPDSGLQVKGHLLSPTIHGPSWLTGGTAGPEGSVVCSVLEVVLILLFWLAYRKKQKPALQVASSAGPS